MPYIKQELRGDLEEGRAPSHSGELNYAITKMIREYLRFKGESYHSFNEVIGVLECAKLELYRRMVAPYENQKWSEHGDVY